MELAAVHEVQSEALATIPFGSVMPLAQSIGVLRMLRIPKRISPCPIHEAVAELRFDGATYGDAVVGIVVAALRAGDADAFPLSVTPLPIAEIPRQLREGDLDLRFKPTHRLIGGKFPVQAGQNVISVFCENPYPGWDEFAGYFRDVFEAVRRLGVFGAPTRLGLRYTNVFSEQDVFELVTLKISHPELGLPGSAMTIRARIRGDQVDSTLQIANSALVPTKSGSQTVSVLDIDTYAEGENIRAGLSLADQFDALHVEEKRVFYSLLLPEYVETLSPEYE